MQTLAEIRAMLDERGLSPRKALGQNFLIDQNLIRKLVGAAGVGAGDLVLEVGPGTGTLTEALLDRGCEVVACELDAGLAGLLRDRLGDRAGFTLVEGDCLRTKSALSPAVERALAGRPFTLVANLPYNIATPLIATLLVHHPGCGAMHVTVQKEVADRLTASPSTKAYGAVSVLAQALAEPSVIATIPAACFWPRPEVTSAMVALPRRADPPPLAPARLDRCCRRLFATRRKQLGAVLGKDVAWPEGVEPTSRAEGLSPPRIAALCASLRDG